MNPWQKTWWDELRQRSVVSLMEISTSIWNLQKHMKQSILHLKTLSRIHLQYQTISVSIFTGEYYIFCPFCGHVLPHLGTY